MATSIFPENITLEAKPHKMLLPRIPFNYLRDEMIQIDPTLTWENYYSRDTKWTPERRAEAMEKVDPRLADDRDIAQPISTRIPAEIVIQACLTAREPAMKHYCDEVRSH